MTDNSKCCGLPLADSGYCVNNPWHEQAPEMTDPVIPNEAVEAATRSFKAELFEEDTLLHPILAHSAQWEARHKMRAALAAALPHLRPLFEVATQVGLELGRQEAAEEIAQAIEATRVPSTEDNSWLLHAARIAREVATRTADARTDPSGHTDLPPTPDAGSKRLPKEAL